MAITTTSEWTIGELSTQTKVNIETIRYYERIGILPKPPRRPGGHRIFGRDHLRRLVFVRRSRELGFSLNDIRAMIDLSIRKDATCQVVNEIASAHLVEIRKKLVDLQRLESLLHGLTEACQKGNVPECPIIDALSSHPEG